MRDVMNCLLIKTKDNRKFLTHKKNLESLIEFSKVFLAEIYLVEKEEGKILELKKLAQSICKQDQEGEVKFRKIERLYPKARRSRKDILKDAQKIQSFIRRKLVDGKTLSLKDLKEKYKDLNVTDACLCNHFANVRKSLKKEGHDFRKIGAGTYCLTTELAKTR